MTDSSSSPRADRAIILAAGRGSRLGALGIDRPKCLVPLGGRPLLSWQLDALAGAGLSRVALVCGYRAEQLRHVAARAFDNPRWAETNMVASLARADAWLREAPCVVAYGDIVYHPEHVARLADAPGEIAITYDRHWLDLWRARFANPLGDAETFAVDHEGALVEIGARPVHLDQVRGQYMGLLKITPAGWARIEAVRARLTDDDRDALDMTSLLSALIASGARVDTIAVDGRWWEVDNEADLRLYDDALASGGQRHWLHERAAALCPRGVSTEEEMHAHR